MPNRSTITVESSLDEHALVEAARSDPDAFVALFDLHFDRIYAFVAGRVENRAEAEDITSEVFHEALAGIAKFEWRGAPFAAWIFRIAANTIADHRKKLQPSVEIQDFPVTDAELDSVESRAAIFQAMEGLPADQRKVLHRRFVDQLSIAEIAGELGRSEGAIKQLQFRGLETLRSKMEAFHG